jgi:hypothetical protein
VKLLFFRSCFGSVRKVTLPATLVPTAAAAL